MARRSSRSRDEFVFVNVTYVDGSLSSNRKVASTLLDGFDGETAVRSVIEAQDREIGERSGNPRPQIKLIERTPRN